MKASELKDGDVVKLRLGRAGKTNVSWRPWQSTTLSVQRNGKGKPSIITPADGRWAEYRPEDFEPEHKVFLVEDYYMQIEGVTEP